MAKLPKPFQTRHVLFSEWNMVKLFKVSKRLMPPFIIIVWLLYYFFHTPIVITIIASVFAFSMPLQAVLWLGYRANSPLIISLLPLYNHLIACLTKKQKLPAESMATVHPNFYQFMSLLSFAQTVLEEEEIFGDDDASQNNGSSL